MHHLQEIAQYADSILNTRSFKDFPGSYNGIQVANHGEIRKIAATVDAGLVPIQEAIERGANLIITHHGLFWGPQRRVIGAQYEKLSKLIQNDCALYSNHLPLDAHAHMGNNALIAKHLRLEVLEGFLPYEGNNIGLVSQGPESREALKKSLTELFRSGIRAFEFGSANPERVGICSGSGASAVDILKEYKLDTLITGELRQAHFNQAQEEKLNLYVCGHYATEVFGVKALAKFLSEHFNLPWEFIETGCPL